MAFSGRPATTLQLPGRPVAASEPPAVGIDAQRHELISAAREIAIEVGSPTFRVQQVVDRAGVSLKAFYRHFGGKDDLLLALFAQDNARGAQVLATLVAPLEAPLERLRGYVVGLFCLVAAGGRTGYTAVLVREHLRLAETHPAELAGALRPLVDLLAAELRRADAAGAIRCAEPDRIAVSVFHTVVAHIHAHVLGQLDADPNAVAEQVWAFCRGALDVSPGRARLPRRRSR